MAGSGGGKMMHQALWFLLQWEARGGGAQRLFFLIEC